MTNGLVDNAVSIARGDLGACITPEGIIAGTHHFVDLWARDSLFATFGLPSKKTIETFLKFQRTDGAVPYRIFRRGGLLLSNFRSVQSGGFVPDGGLMVLLHTKNEKALQFYRNRYGSGLITEWFQCEWADAVLKFGKVLFTNVLYWQATHDAHIKKKIHDTFWNGKYFADWVDWQRQDYFAAHPNMLAIVWGLTNKKESSSILDFAKNNCWNGWALEENYPRYPWWRIPLHHYIVGMADYHNRGCIWLQPAILYAMALAKVGENRESEVVFKKISKKIVEYNGVYEVYEKSGRPVKRFFYRAEHPFAWSAGLFLWAYRDYFTS